MQARTDAGLIPPPVGSPAADPEASHLFRYVVKSEQVRARTRREGVSEPALVAEFDKRSRLVKKLDDGSDLPARKPVRGKVRQQGYCIEQTGF
jgi:hypothetical protein